MTEETTTPERRKQWHTPETCRNIIDVKAQFDDGADRMQRIEENVQRVADHQVETDAARQRLEDKLDNNTELTQKLLGYIESARGFFRVMGWIFEAAKWAAGVALSLGSVWFLFKDHHK